MYGSKKAAYKWKVWEKRIERTIVIQRKIQSISDIGERDRENDGDAKSSATMMGSWLIFMSVCVCVCVLKNHMRSSFS